jgi:hypothetical protein
MSESRTRRGDESFELDVAGRDALDAFEHPFADGARLGLV